MLVVLFGGAIANPVRWWCDDEGGYDCDNDYDQDHDHDGNDDDNDDDDDDALTLSCKSNLNGKITLKRILLQDIQIG